MTVTHVSQKRAGWWAGWLSLFVLLARVNAYNLGGSHISAMQRGKLLLGPHVPSNLRTPSGLSAKRSSGSGGGAIPPTQADNIQSWEIGPPPDLPSLLLNNRIIYVGMPLVPSVTELVIAQLLYLNYQNDALITLYLNSPGTNSPDGKAFSFDTEAFAIADTMQFIRPPIRTICVGQAFGTAAMLLSLGQKGNRFALPNASIMLNQPKSRARGQASDVAIKAKEIINNRKVTNEFLAKACGKDLSAIEKDTQRVRYLSPEEAIEYGLIDKVLYPEELRAQAPRFLEFL